MGVARSKARCSFCASFSLRQVEQRKMYGRSRSRPHTHFLTQCVEASSYLRFLSSSVSCTANKKSSPHLAPGQAYATVVPVSLTMISFGTGSGDGTVEASTDWVMFSEAGEGGLQDAVDLLEAG